MRSGVAPMMDWKPQAVVFDCDGLLVESESCWTVAETALFARHGLEFGAEQKARLIGKSLPAVAHTMADTFGDPGSAAEVEAELVALVLEALEQARPMPGAADLVKRVQGVMPLAVASNSPRLLLDAALKGGGFAEVFPIGIAGDEVDAPKPAPDMYLLACQRLGVHPDRVVAFEDSMTGVLSARAAGVRVIGVPTLPEQDLPADVVVPSLTEILSS